MLPSIARCLWWFRQFREDNNKFFFRGRILITFPLHEKERKQINDGLRPAWAEGCSEALFRVPDLVEIMRTTRASIYLGCTRISSLNPPKMQTIHLQSIALDECGFGSVLQDIWWCCCDWHHSTHRLSATETWPLELICVGLNNHGMFVQKNFFR